MQGAEYAWCGVAKILGADGRPLKVHQCSDPVAAFVDEAPVTTDGSLQAGPDSQGVFP